MHFFFAVGALASPLLVNHVMRSAVEFDGAFYCVTAYLLLCSSGLLLARAPPTDQATPQADQAAAAAGGGAIRGGTLPSCGSAEFAVLVLTGCFLFVYVGAESSYSTYLIVYSVAQFPSAFTQAQGQLLQATFWGALTAGRLVAVPLSTAVAPITQLAANAAGCVGAAAWMLLKPDSPEALWYGTAVFGASMASCFPSVLTLAQQYVKLSGRAQVGVRVARPPQRTNGRAQAAGGRAIARRPSR
jgi:fucose permease